MEPSTPASPPGSPTGRGVPGATSLLPPASPTTTVSALPASGTAAAPAAPLTVASGATAPSSSTAVTTGAANNLNGVNQSALTNGTTGVTGTDPYGMGGMGGMSDPYGYGGGMYGSGMYGSGMYGGGLYGGGMYGGLGGMGMMGMGMMPGMMGMGMTPDAQRGQMMMLMISSMVQLWGMFSQVVQGTFGSMIQFVGNYVTINQRLGQIREEGMTQEEQFFHHDYETKQALLELPESDRVSAKHVRERRYRRRQKPPTSTVRSVVLRLLRHLVLAIVAYFVATRVGRLWSAKTAKQIS